MSVPIPAVVFILAFITSVTEYPIASVLLMDGWTSSPSVGAQQYLYPQNYLWGDFAAAAVLSGLAHHRRVPLPARSGSSVA